MIKIDDINELKKWCIDIKNRIDNERAKEEEIINKMNPKLFGEDLEYTMHRGSERYFAGFTSALEKVIEMIE